MLILLLDTDLRESAKRLDSTTLVEQCREVYNTLLILLKYQDMKEQRVAEWEDYIPTLVLYALELCRELEKRQLSLTDRIKILNLTQDYAVESPNLPSWALEASYCEKSIQHVLQKTSFEYVRANAAVKVHDKLGLTLDQAEKMLQKAREDYFWYDQFGWRK